MIKKVDYTQIFFRPGQTLQDRKEKIYQELTVNRCAVNILEGTLHHNRRQDLPWEESGDADLLDAERLTVKFEYMAMESQLYKKHMQFTDLIFHPHERREILGENAVHAKVDMLNGYEVSIIGGGNIPGCDGVNSFEVEVFTPEGNTLNSDPFRNQHREQVMGIIRMVADYPKT